jgi:DNA-3-methyladenine glycosylase
MILPRSFYARPTLAVARDLLGKVLVHCTPDGTTSGAIVEIEAYIGEDDPACHAAPGPTRRNEPLYGDPGCAYVYLNYGVHDLFNVVTEPRGRPAAVLVRALEPVDGVALMQARRATRGREVPVHLLCRGPGNLTRAMGITLAHNRADLCAGDRLFLEDRGATVTRIARSPRIGIAAGVERMWRFYDADSAAVSGKRRT